MLARDSQPSRHGFLEGCMSKIPPFRAQRVKRRGIMLIVKKRIPSGMLSKAGNRRLTVAPWILSFQGYSNLNARNNTFRAPFTQLTSQLTFSHPKQINIQRHGSAQNIHQYGGSPKPILRVVDGFKACQRSLGD
jgi:hypothetical protein